MRPLHLITDRPSRRPAVVAALFGVLIGPGALAVQQAAATSPATTPPAATTPAATTPPATTPAAATPPAGEEADGRIIPAAPTNKVSYAARLIVPVVVRKTPGTRGKKITALRPFGSWNGGPVVLPIAQVKTFHGERWIRVRLPIRPNGSTGWIKEAKVEVTRLRYRITVSRSLHRLTLFRDGKKVASTSVVVGAGKTPTPKGTFAVLEVVRQPKGEVIGPWALHLTAHSNVLDNYGGGPGRVALHGRSGGLLSDPLGTSRSHGCVRMPNAFITRLHSVATEGTPVVIT